MHRLFLRALTILSAVTAIACSEGPSAPDLADKTKVVAPGVVVSNPFANAAGINAALGVGAVQASSLAYVSAPPGTFPGASQVTLRNTTRNTPSQSAVVRDGGFDPVAIEAGAGDEIALTVFGGTAGEGPLFVKVPPRRPPQVVRTSPPKGRTDVALNVQVSVIFSEPIDQRTLTTASLVLRQGAARVPSKVSISSDGLSAEIVPDRALDPGSDYSVDILATIVDLDGDALANPLSVDFTTETTGPNADLLVTSMLDRDIYSVNIDGTGSKRLTVGGTSYRARWSPDGRRIVYAHNIPSSENRGFGTADIFIMDADGTNVVRRTTGAFFWSAAWSPDGRKLLLSDEEVYFAHIYIMSADDDGTAPALLIADGRSPQWSPDGTQIAYVHTSGDDGYHQVYLMNADGSNAHELTAIDPGGIGGVAWSPDGKRIAFSKCLDGKCDIYVMAADGTQLTLLAAVGDAGDVSWSPDGAWIAFSADDYSNGVWTPSVKYIPAGGGSPRVAVANAFHPSWRPK